MSQQTIDHPDTDHLNPGDEHWDDRLNDLEFEPSDEAKRDLAEMEQRDAGAGAGDSYGDSPVSSTDAGDTVRDRESSPGDAPWLNNTTSSGGDAKGKALDTLKKVALNRGGPTAIISTILVTAGISLSMLFSPTMLLVHIKEAILDRFNIQNTALDKRADKMLAKKLASTATKNCSGAVKIGCKFNKMSNSMLQRMADSGMVPYKDGKPMDLKDGKWGTQRPDDFRPSEKARADLNLGKDEKILAKDFAKYLKANPSAAGVFRQAFNPRWTSFWDSTYKSFLTKVGFGAKNSKIKSGDNETVDKSISEQIDAPVKETPVHAAQQDTQVDENATEAEKKAAQEANSKAAPVAGEADDILGDAGKSASKDLVGKIKGKIGGGAMMVVNLYCIATVEGPKIAKALRAIQLAQLVAFGLLFLQAADEIIAGHGDATKISRIASKFSDESVDAVSGKVLKKSAMESDGLLYALAGNTAFKSQTSQVSRWVPGGGLIQMIYKLSNMLTGGSAGIKEFITPVCNTLNSWLGDLAGLALNFTPVGAIITAATYLITNSPPFQEMMAGLFENLAGKIVNGAIANEDFGNAFGVSAVLGIGEGGNAGAMMPMTVDQAVAYSRATQENRIANAKIDQATHSPFDATNPNTFLGSITSQLLPYYGSITSGPVGTLGALSKVVGSTFGSLLTPHAFADANLTADDLKSCPDVGITQDGIAAGPICDIQYGIPVNYLDNIDPSDNVDWLIGKGDVKDDEDGTIVPGSDLESYLKTCQQGEETTTKACIIDNEEKARYALYFVDHRIQKNMDGEESYGGSGQGNTSTAATPAGANAANGATAPPGTEPSNKGWTLVDNKDYSDVPCVDNGASKVETHITHGYVMRICDNVSGINKVNSLISANVKNMVAAAKADGVTLTGSAYRGADEQMRLRQAHCPDPVNSPSSSCSPPTAKVGTSMHERGLAIDFENCSTRSTSCYQWLSQNASKFGLINLPSEAWHWSTSGS